MVKNHFVSVAGFVTNDKEEVLLIKSPWRGWEFPGGVVEENEDLEEALIREVFEESGVEVEITGFIGVCKNVSSDVLSLDFSCKYIKGKLTTSEESLEVGWFSKAEALSMVKNEIIKKRLENMLLDTKEVQYFSFDKEPFKVINERLFKVGNK